MPKSTPKKKTKKTKVPKKYTSGLSGKVKQEREEQVRKRAKASQEGRPDYSPMKGDDKVKTKPSRYTKQAELDQSDRTLDRHNEILDAAIESFDSPLPPELQPMMNELLDAHESGQLPSSMREDQLAGIAEIARGLASGDNFETMPETPATKQDPKRERLERLKRMYKPNRKKVISPEKYVISFSHESGGDNYYLISIGDPREGWSKFVGLVRHKEGVTGWLEGNKDKISEDFIVDISGLNLVSDRHTDFYMQMQEGIKNEIATLQAERSGLKTKIQENMVGKGKEAYLKAVAKSTGYPLGILREVHERGARAWATGHRVGASQVAWSRSRVLSFVQKGKTTKTADQDLAQRARDIMQKRKKK